MLNVGIIGMGRMGKSHAGFFTTSPETRLVGFYDPNATAVQEGTEKFNVPAFASADELINSPDVEAVVIASPTYCHATDVIKVMKTGKHLFCEKPLCRNWEEADAIRQAADRSTTKLQIGFVRRFSPAQQLMVKLVKEGALGAPRYCHIDLFTGKFRRMPGDWFANYTLCGGVVLDLLSHHLDLLSWCFGAPDPLYAQGFLEDPRLPEPVDYSSATITFANGVICNIASGWNRFGRSANFMEIYGDKGYASYNWGKNTVTFMPKDGETQELEAPAVDNPYYEGFRHWLKAIQENRQPDVTLDDAFNALDLALGILRSSEEGTVVEF